MAEARDRLLDQVLEYVAAHGLSNRSLRDLATGIGSSHRMLNYHFGSRDGLVAAIVSKMETQQQAALADLADVAITPTDLVRRQWELLSDPNLAPFERLFFEVLAQALHGRPGTAGFLEQLTAPWIEMGAVIAGQLGVVVTETELLLGIAVVRGLVLEMLVSGDADASTAALAQFLSMWEQSRALPSRS